MNFIKSYPKSILFFSSSGYYLSYKFLYQRQKERQLRFDLFSNFAKYSQQTLGPTDQLKRVTVLLNPAGGNYTTEKQFKQNVEPMLYVAGLLVNVVRTDRAAELKQLMSVLEQKHADALLVAGGDGTLLELATGLMRRSDAEAEHIRQIPIFALPFGSANHSQLRLPQRPPITAASSQLDKIQRYGCVIQKLLDFLSVSDSSSLHSPATKMRAGLCIQPMPIQSECVASQNQAPIVSPPPLPPTFALSSLDWSVQHDLAHPVRHAWLFGYRNALIWSGLCDRHNSNLKCARIVYSPHCAGCSRCCPSSSSSINSASSFPVDSGASSSSVASESAVSSPSIMSRALHGLVGNQMRKRVEVKVAAANQSNNQNNVQYERWLAEASLRDNPECGTEREMRLDSDFGVRVIIQQEEEPEMSQQKATQFRPRLLVSVHRNVQQPQQQQHQRNVSATNNTTLWNYWNSLWSAHNDVIDLNQRLEVACQSVVIYPDLPHTETKTAASTSRSLSSPMTQPQSFFIDNDSYDARAVRITAVPNMLTFGNI